MATDQSWSPQFIFTFTPRYRVGDPVQDAWSEKFQFVTMDPNQTEARIATFGDM